tara:strand:+ start:1008 stop:1271 length:264 start_codon:yes stop_codon:yes gene_type:complete
MLRQWLITENIKHRFFTESPAIDTYTDRLLYLNLRVFCKQHEYLYIPFCAVLLVTVFKFATYKIEILPPGLALKGPGVIEAARLALE